MRMRFHKLLQTIPPTRGAVPGESVKHQTVLMYPLLKEDAQSYHIFQALYGTTAPPRQTTVVPLQSFPTDDSKQQFSALIQALGEFFVNTG